MDTYLILKQHHSPVFAADAKPHFIVSSRKEARVLTDELNAKAAKYEYWFEKVKNNL